MSRPLAVLDGVQVVYGGRPALGPLDLVVSAGEAVALVGPSGCGKSTTLRLLAGLEAPSAGQVRSLVPAGEVSMVFQAPTLAPWLSALANVALPLRLSGVAAKDADARAAAALDRVGLAGRHALRPAQLSGGMAMRVALARALVTRPKLLLLDEPFAALDEITRRALADDVLTLAAQLSCALVFITHSVEEAVYMADRVLVLTPGPGRVAQEIRLTAPLPRPPAFRAAPQFRDTVEAVSAALAAAMEPQP